MFLLYMSGGGGGGGFRSQTESAADHESCLTERVDALLSPLCLNHRSRARSAIDVVADQFPLCKVMVASGWSQTNAIE